MLTYILGRPEKLHSRTLNKCRIAEMQYNENNHGAYFEILPISNFLYQFAYIPFPLHSILSVYLV